MVEADAIGFPLGVELAQELFIVNVGKVVCKKDATLRCFRVDFIWEPLLGEIKFLFQLFDNTFANVAERSDVVGINDDFLCGHDVLIWLKSFPGVLMSMNSLKVGIGWWPRSTSSK